MTVLRDDSFGRADENPLASPYATPSTMGSLKLVSNAVGNVTGSSDSGMYDNGSTYPDNQWAEVTIGTVGGSDCGPSVRQSSGGNHYCLTNYDAATIYLFKVTGGTSYNQIGTAAGTYAAGDVIYLEAQGDGTSTTLVAKKNGSTIITYTDTTTPFTGGKAGMFGFDGTYRFSRFRGGDFAAGGTSDPQKKYLDDLPAAYYADPGYAAIYVPYQQGITVASRSEGPTVNAAAGSITAANTTTGVGAATQKANASDTNTSALTGVGAATAKADASSTAQLTLTGVGRATVSGAGSITAVESQTGVGASTAKAAASDTNTTTLTGVGAATASAAAGATGVLTLTGQGAAVGSGAGDGTITITSGMTGAGAATASAAGFTLKTTDPSLVLGLNFDGDFTDISAYGHTMTVSGASVSSSQVKAGSGACSFTTIGQSIYIASPGKEWNFNTTEGCTWEQWVYATTVDATRRSIFDWRFDGSGAGTTIALDFTSSGLRLQVGVNGTLYTASTATTLTANTYQHVAAVIDGTTARLYLDGTQIASASISAGILSAASGGSVPVWGRKNDSTQNFGGFMDLIQVHASTRYPGGTSFTPAASVLTSPAEYSGLFGVGAAGSPTVNAADGAITLTGNLAGIGAATAKADASDTNVLTLTGVGSSSGPVIVSADGGITIVGALTGTGAAKAGAAGSVSMAGNLYGNTDLAAGGSDTGGGKKRKRRGQIDLERDEEEMLEIAALIVPLLGSSAWAR